ncbi:MAG TPA: DUF1211 domain-containing protein [Anaerolineae bacterium]|nr:DUF1211 domain-containing protein [Anaerolineae bacterium]
MSKLESTVPNELKQEATLKNRLALERLVFFSDAVFAIAITILVLDIRLPNGADSASSRELLLSLASLWHKYLAFFISFWVIGLSWISHHRKFLYIQRVDNQLLTLNLLMLMMIAFIPFPTAVMSETVNFTATGFYALTMILACLSGLILWWYAARNHRLVDANLDRHQIWREASVPLATIAIFMLSMGVAVLDAGLARICWVLLFPVALFLRRRAA